VAAATRDGAPGAEFTVLDDSTGRNSRNYDGRPACCGNNNCMPLCPIRCAVSRRTGCAAAEDSGVKVITEAVVYRLEHDDKGRIAAVHYYDWNKASHRITAQTFVLAANAIETPKLLLMSVSDKFPQGIANARDNVGRNLCDHPAIGVTFDVDEEIWPGRGPVSPAPSASSATANSALNMRRSASIFPMPRRWPR
jgi:choline dehydrogenase-like flavoprotein